MCAETYVREMEVADGGVVVFEVGGVLREVLESVSYVPNQKKGLHIDTYFQFSL